MGSVSKRNTCSSIFYQFVTLPIFLRVLIHPTFRQELSGSGKVSLLGYNEVLTDLNLRALWNEITRLGYSVVLLTI